jgi:hypothetical protein
VVRLRVSATAPTTCVLPSVGGLVRQMLRRRIVSRETRPDGIVISGMIEITEIADHNPPEFMIGIERIG